MTRICFPHHEKGEFDSLNKAVNFFIHSRNSRYIDYILEDIVRYNICYRDHWRSFGLDSLMERLSDEAPGIDYQTLDKLRKSLECESHVAPYDIQCYNIHDKITILGHTFNGLIDISRHCEIVGYGSFFGLNCFTPKDAESYDDIHIGEVYERYPVFDSSDLCDDRTYQNYIFRPNPITQSDMEEAFKIPHRMSCCMVHEEIPSSQLPILYYQGDGDYYLLATAKE